jgi:hypothetical protein
MNKKVKEPKIHYVNNAEFLKALISWKKDCADAEDCGEDRPAIPNYIGECILKISTRLATRPNFNNYTYLDDMILDGVENCIQYLHNFDPDKSKNPFAYFTQIIYYAFLRRIMKERKQSYIKTKILTSLPPTFFQELGMSPEQISEAERNFDKFLGKMEQAIQSQNNFDNWLIKKSIARKIKNNIETLDDDKDSDYN